MKIQSFYYSIASSSSSLTLASASFGFSGMTMPFQTRAMIFHQFQNSHNQKDLPRGI